MALMVALALILSQVTGRHFTVHSTDTCVSSLTHITRLAKAFCQASPEVVGANHDDRYSI